MSFGWKDARNGRLNYRRYRAKHLSKKNGPHLSRMNVQPTWHQEIVDGSELLPGLMMRPTPDTNGMYGRDAARSKLSFS